MPENNSTASDYKFSEEIPHTNDYLSPVVLDECRKSSKAETARVIDLGCGNGYLCRDLHAEGYQVVGIDPSASGIAAQRLVPQASFYNTGIYDSPSLVAEEGFDLAVSTEVIEHLFYPRELARFAHAKLRPGGVLIISTPYHGYLKNVILALVGKWDFHHNPLWDGGHIKFWSRETLTRLLEEEGFRVVRFRGCGRLPLLWKSMIFVAEKG
jgi:2-polyprenyl-3-methyl-5-hydroxy-6-metoxy-1,4-benzoquinol methylase